MDTPNEASLRQMPYSELKKYAKSRGIKKNKLKTERLIASILERTRCDDDSFVTMEQKIINSCKKHKLEKFDEDMKVVSDTPRRETYIIDSPLDSIPLNKDLISSSASPVLKTSPVAHEASMNVTVSRGSERKPSKRKVSFVTPIRRSARLSTLTPHYASVKDRPKTPIPSNRKRESFSSVGKKSFSGSLYISNTARKSDGEKKRPSTPMPQSKPKRMKLDSTGLLETPISSPCFTPKGASSTVQQKITFTPESGIKNNTARASLSITKVRKITTPKSGVKHVTQCQSPFSITKVKRTGTPKSIIKHDILPVSLSITKVKGAGTPMPSIKSSLSSNKKVQPTRTPMSSIKSSLLSNKKVQPTHTPKSGVKHATSSVHSVPNLKRVITPNFNKLHQKEFDKMESIDEYQKRRALNSAKKVREQLKFHEPTKVDLSKKVVQKKNSKIPKKFGGIPFIPSVTSIKNIKTNFGISNLSLNTTSGKRLPAVKFGQKNERNLSKKLVVEGSEKSLRSVLRENTPLRRNKFDLKASLSKKLPYKPHAGPLKPLVEMNLNNPIQLNTCPPQKTATKNQVIQSKRIESRGILRGVRKNKRFELQMKNRK